MNGLEKRKMENQRVRLTKRLLKDALISLMQALPFDRITVKKLCEEAGINRTTFYLHYNDTEQLLLEAENDIISVASDMITGPDRSRTSLECISGFLSYVQLNSLHFKTLLTFKDSEVFIQRFSQDVVSSVKPYLNDLDMSDDKKEYLLYFALVGSLAVIREWILSGFRTPAGEMAELIDRMTTSVIRGSEKN